MKTDVCFELKLSSSMLEDPASSAVTPKYSPRRRAGQKKKRWILEHGPGLDITNILLKWVKIRSFWKPWFF